MGNIKRYEDKKRALDFLYKELGNDFFELAKLQILDDLADVMNKYRKKRWHKIRKMR
jgi:hypothetical protein